MFSPNEELKEIATENLKLLMAPYYEADVLFRIMDKRAERVKLAHVFYIEYLRLLQHYGVLEKEQVKQLKRITKKQKVQYTLERTDAQPEDIKEMQEMIKDLQASKPSPYEDRDSKIAEFRLKKMISQQLDDLKNYSDEEMKRDFYMAQIRHSVLEAFEQLRTIDMELDILKHQAKLTPEQIAEN